MIDVAFSGSPSVVTGTDAENVQFSPDFVLGLAQVGFHTGQTESALPPRRQTIVR